MQSFNIGKYEISKLNKPFIIAEISANHHGKLENALKLVKESADAGVDAIKIQTYTADTITINCDKDDFQINGGTWDGQTLHKLYSQAYTPWEWHQEIFDYAKKFGLEAFSSPFDPTAVDFLESLNVPAYKIASFELIDHPLIEKVAKTMKPIIISTGMASMEEITEALTIIKKYHNNFCVLHCISGYPTPVEESNLKRMISIEQEHACLVGLSDHTLTTTNAIISTTMGASVIEKHIISSRKEGGPDSTFSLEPNEFKILVDNVKQTQAAIGDGKLEIQKTEVENKSFRKSIYVVKDIKKGESFSRENTKCIRPGYGLKPKYYNEIIGKKSTCNISFGTALSWQLIER